MIYNLIIALYDLAVHIISPFSRKPRKMMKGHWVVYELLRQQLEPGYHYIWFHAASLGEFEQGRPLMEKIRASYPEYKLLLTFFSPSGYEVRKNYRGADIVCYLPFDKPRNVKKRWSAETPAIMEELIALIEGLESFESKAAEEQVIGWITAKGYHMGNVMNAFRLAVVGECKGPHMFDITELLGKEETIRRIREAVCALSVM